MKTQEELLMKIMSIQVKIEQELAKQEIYSVKWRRCFAVTILICI